MSQKRVSLAQIIIRQYTNQNMKLTWKKQSNKKKNKRPFSSISDFPNLPFQQDDDPASEQSKADGTEPGPNRDICYSTKDAASSDRETTQLAESFREQGNKLAEDGKYREALGRWEAALTLTPDRAALHEQKAQVLLEIGEAWNALKAATRATELEPSWAEAWITLGRAQLNFGEPDNAIESFDRALAIKANCITSREEAKAASVIRLK